MTERKNVIEKFKAFVAKLDDEDAAKLWRVLTALRGPDSKSLPQKYSSIAIRDVVWPKNHRYNVPASFVFNRSRWKGPSNVHYNTHIISALKVLEELGYELPIKRNDDRTVSLREPS